MKITNKLAAYALILSFLIIGSLFAFGMTNQSFTITYFVIISVTLFLAALTIQGIFKNRKDLFFVIMVLIVMAGSITILAGSAKAFVDNRNNLMGQYRNLSEDINNINSINKYYADYAEYLSQMLNATSSNTLKMQGQLNSLILGGNNLEATTILNETPEQLAAEDRREYTNENEELEEDGDD